MNRCATLMLPLLALSAMGSAQTNPPAAAAMAYDPAVAKAAVAKLADEIESKFVFPGVGRRYAEVLRTKLRKGGYDRVTDAQALATQVTADLQAVQPDGHLGMRAPGGGPTPGLGKPLSPDRDAIEQTDWLAKGVAYIRFNGFPESEATLASLRTFLRDYADAKTLIIDVRAHRGGGIEEMDLLFAQLFDAPRTVMRMDTRASVAGEGDDFPPTMPAAEGPAGIARREHRVIPAAQATGLRTAKVHLLVSGGTASAGEHLAMVLKKTGRATLIGEPTAGAGHYGGMFELPGGYSAFIPFGRSYDPVSGEGWEGTGVAPDVAVPAADALIEALTRTGLTRAAATGISATHVPSGKMERRAPIRPAPRMTD